MEIILDPEFTTLKFGLLGEYIYFYIIKQDILIYVPYSWPNGWTERADIFCRHSWVAGMCLRLKNSNFKKNSFFSPQANTDTSASYLYMYIYIIVNFNFLVKSFKCGKTAGVTFCNLGSAEFQSWYINKVVISVWMSVFLLV